MDENFSLTDFDDRPLTVGTRVRIWDYSPIEKIGRYTIKGEPREYVMHPVHPDWGTGKAARFYGVVTEIDDWDGDVDDNGHSISIPPRVYVLFDDGSTDSFATSEWEIHYGWWDRATGDGDHDTGEGKVEELVVVSTVMHP